MSDRPFSFDVEISESRLSTYDNHIVRHLSSLEGQFSDEDAYREMLAKEDVLVYEVYERKRPETPGELLHGLSVVHPGKVGKEYYMTKGHFHAVLETGEIYYCLKGEGVMVMETPEGGWAIEVFKPGRVVYVPPRWAHRSVNTGDEQDLVTFFVYPADAGHDYGTIEVRGFRKLVVEESGQMRIVDNPRWRPHEDR